LYLLACVASLSTNASAKRKIHVVWRGGDPLAISEVINALREAGIRHHVQPNNEHLVF
jgi:organic radical activating enzyme